MFRLGLIINPLAGIGGTVALKGSDGEETVKQAQQLGAVSQAQTRTRIALEQIHPFKDRLVIYTAANDMGENLCREMGFHVEVLAVNEINHSKSSYFSCSSSVQVSEQTAAPRRFRPRVAPARK